MSHFTVLVVGDNAEEQLAPFEEDLKVVFTDSEDEYLLDYDTGSSTAYRDEDGKWRFDKDSCKLQYKDMYDTFEDFMLGWHGHKSRDAISVDGEIVFRYGYWSNPQTKWDWYQLGGRWTGFFTAKPDVVLDKTNIGSPGLFTDEALLQQVDRIKKGDIDIKAMQDAERTRASAHYDKFLAATNGLPIPFSFEEIKLQYVDIDDARSAYRNQPFIKAMRTELNSWACPFSVYYVNNGGKERYVEERVDTVYRTFAVLKDGVWYEKGKMGWFGYAANEDEDWDQKFNELWDSIPDDAYVSLYDCHV